MILVTLVKLKISTFYRVKINLLKITMESKASQIMSFEIIVQIMKESETK